MKVLQLFVVLFFWNHVLKNAIRLINFVLVTLHVLFGFLVKDFEFLIFWMFTEIRVDWSIYKELLLNDNLDGLLLPRRSSSRWGSSRRIGNQDRHRLDIYLIFQFFIVLDCLFESSSFVKSLLFILSLLPLFFSSFVFLIQRRWFCIFCFWFALIYLCLSWLRLSIFWFLNFGLSIRLWALKVLRICRKVSLIGSLKQRLNFIFYILLFVSTIRVIEK